MSVQSVIETKLSEALSPSHLQVLNESHMHRVPPNSETHFKVVVVSERFAGKRDVARHQMIYGLLAEEIEAGVHALVIHTYTEPEWQQRDGAVPSTPGCRGGGQH